MVHYRHKIPRGVVVLCVLLSTRDIHQSKLPSIYRRKCLPSVFHDAFQINDIFEAKILPD